MQVISSVSLVSEGYLPDNGTGYVVGIQHLSDLESVCVATGKGDVIIWNTITKQARISLSFKNGMLATVIWETLICVSFIR